MGSSVGIIIPNIWKKHVWNHQPVVHLFHWDELLARHSFFSRDDPKQSADLPFWQFRHLRRIIYKWIKMGKRLFHSQLVTYFHSKTPSPHSYVMSTVARRNRIKTHQHQPPAPLRKSESKSYQPREWGMDHHGRLDWNLMKDTVPINYPRLCHVTPHQPHHIHILSHIYPETMFLPTIVDGQTSYKWCYQPHQTLSLSPLFHITILIITINSSLIPRPAQLKTFRVPSGNLT